MNAVKRRSIFERFRDANPHPQTELVFANAFELLVAVVRSRPPSTVVRSMPRMESRVCSTSRVTLSVLSSEAPSGRRIAQKTTPWSSSGRNPAGTILNNLSAARCDRQKKM